MTDSSHRNGSTNHLFFPEFPMKALELLFSILSKPVIIGLPPPFVASSWKPHISNTALAKVAGIVFESQFCTAALGLL